MKIPYERVVAWLAGPIAALVGWGATQLVAHVGVFSAIGVTHDQIAKAIVAAVTFGMTTLCTYLAHAKWMNNLSAWWQHVDAVAGRTPPPVYTPSETRKLVNVPPAEAEAPLSVDPFFDPDTAVEGDSPDLSEGGEPADHNPSHALAPESKSAAPGAPS